MSSPVTVAPDRVVDIDPTFAEDVLAANRALVDLGLVIQTFGNVSARFGDFLVIKPSGIDLTACRPADLAVVEIASGAHLSGLKPSSDTPTHRVLYQRYPRIGAVAHFHGPATTTWAQAGRAIPCLGTTHADYWDGPIPVSRQLSADEVADDYEGQTGHVIAETLETGNQDPVRCPGVLVTGHGPFCWGQTARQAVLHAEVMEFTAALAFSTLSLSRDATTLPDYILRKHFDRKHGPGAYYGQGS